MPFEILAGEPLPEAFERMAIEQLSASRAIAEGGQTDADEIVHQIRKSLKRVRALVQMLRKANPPSGFEAERVALRDLARRLSAIRDSAVMIETIDALMTGKAGRAAYGDLREHFVDEHARLSVTFFEDRGMLGEVALELQRLEARVPLWTAFPNEFDSVGRSVELIYKKGRSRFDKAQRLESARHFHDWRKWAKYLWFVCQVFTPIEPRRLEGLADALDRLGDALGKEHDLYNQSVLVKGRADVLRAIERKRQKLQRRALSIGREVYSVSPETFGEELERAFVAWRARSAILDPSR